MLIQQSAPACQFDALGGFAVLSVKYKGGQPSQRMPVLTFQGLRRRCLEETHETEGVTVRTDSLLVSELLNKLKWS